MSNILVLDGQKFVKEIGSSREQRPSAHIQGFPPPGVGHPGRNHHPATFLRNHADFHNTQARRKECGSRADPAPPSGTRGRPRAAAAAFPRFLLDSLLVFIDIKKMNIWYINSSCLVFKSWQKQLRVNVRHSGNLVLLSSPNLRHPPLNCGLHPK